MVNTMEITHREKIENFNSKVGAMEKENSAIEKYKANVRGTLKTMSDNPAKYSTSDLVQKALDFWKVAKRDEISDIAVDSAVYALKFAQRGLKAQEINPNLEDRLNYAVGLFEMAKDYGFDPLVSDIYDKAKGWAEEYGYDEKNGRSFAYDLVKGEVSLDSDDQVAA